MEKRTVITPSVFFYKSDYDREYNIYKLRPGDVAVSFEYSDGLPMKENGRKDREDYCICFFLPALMTDWEIPLSVSMTFSPVMATD